MKGPRSRVGESAAAAAEMSTSAAPRPSWLLVLPAAATELLYVLVLRLGNLKERVETFLVLALLLGILYFVSLYLA